MVQVCVAPPAFVNPSSSRPQAWKLCACINPTGPLQCWSCWAWCSPPCHHFQPTNHPSNQPTNHLHACLAAVLELLGLVYPILEAADPPLAAALHGSGLPPFFALSWLITWFSHDVEDLQVSRASPCHPASQLALDGLYAS